MSSDFHLSETEIVEFKKGRIWKALEQKLKDRVHELLTAYTAINLLGEIPAGEESSMQISNDELARNGFMIAARIAEDNFIREDIFEEILADQAAEKEEEELDNVQESF